MLGSSSKALIDLLTPREIPGLALERWGPASDGGYVVPVELMRNAKFLISGGVADNVRFESEVAEKIPGIRIGLFDHTITSVPDHTPENARWHRLGFGSGEDFISLERAAELAGAGPEEPIAIKLDIEAAEWDLINSTPSELWKRVDFLIIEFHQFEKRSEWARYRTILEKLNRNFILVHAHGNNCSPTVHFRKQGVYVPMTLENTYIHRRWIPSGPEPAIWNHAGPTPIDRPNDPSQPDIQLDYWVPRTFVFFRRLKKNISRMLSLR